MKQKDFERLQHSVDCAELMMTTVQKIIQQLRNQLEDVASRDNATPQLRFPDTEGEPHGQTDK